MAAGAFRHSRLHGEPRVCRQANRIRRAPLNHRARMLHRLAAAQSRDVTCLAVKMKHVKVRHVDLDVPVQYSCNCMWTCAL